MDDTKQQLADVKKRLDDLERRLHQSDIPTGTIKSRHLQEGISLTSPTVTGATITDGTSAILATLLKSLTTSINVASATAPTTGQVLTATSSSAATWQTPASYTSLFKIGTTTRSQSAADGTQSITGVGFLPKVVLFFAGVNTVTGHSMGIDDGTNHYCVVEATTGVVRTASGYSIETYDNSSWDEKGYISALGSDGFTLTWVKGGTPAAGTIDIYYLCFG